MADQDQDPKQPSTEDGNKGFCLNKAEQVSRIWHNIWDGAYKFIIVIGVIVGIVIAANVYFTMKATTNKVHNTYCESVFWCDTPAETAAKAEKDRIKAVEAAAEAEEERIQAEIKAAEEEKRAEAIANGEEEPGMIARGWGWAANKWSGDEEPTEAESN